MDLKEATEILKERIALIKSEYPEMADYREALEMAVNAIEKRTVIHCNSIFQILAKGFF